MSESIDEIRAKRLAKLGASATSTPSQSRSPVPSESAPVKRKSEEAAQPPQPPQPKSSPQIAARPTPTESLSAWTNKELTLILGTTLDLEGANDGVVFLESTFSELVEENHDPVFTEELIDRAILELLTEIGVENPFRYLKDTWKKSQQSRRLIKAKDPLRAEKCKVLDEVDRLTSSYGLVSFQIPDMFQNGDVEFFLKEIISNENSYSEFLTEIIGRAEEEGTLLDFLNIFIPSLSKLIANLDLNQPSYPLILNIFQLLLSDKKVASVFTQIDGFAVNDQLEARLFESTTILGPIFRLSPLQNSVAVGTYGNIQNNREANQAHGPLQSEHKVLLDRLFFITDKIIRGSEQSRQDLLQYFATIINKNHLRRGEYANRDKLSTDEFITNIALVLVKLSLPFTDPSLSKIDRIDMNYFQKASQLLDITEETRVNSSATEANEYLEKHKSEDKPNFISDCFYLTMAYLHYGIGGTILADNTMKRSTKQLARSVEQMKRIIAQKGKNDPMSKLYAMRLTTMEKQLSSQRAQIRAIEGFFTNKDMQLEIFEVICGACAFFVKTIDPTHAYPKGKLSLPLIPDVIGVENVDNTEYFRTKAPVPYKYFPEFTIEGIVNYISYISRFTRSPLFGNPRLHTLVEFSVTFLRCPELIGNPHLKGRLVETLSSGAMELYKGQPGYMMDIFESNPLVVENLLYALLDFYVVVEKTGSSSQFYDKFNSRYHISVILKEIWKAPIYQRQLMHQSEHNEEFFIRFVARMLNDLTFLLDESLRHLTEVHSIQTELENRQNGVSNMEGTNEELEGRLSSAEGQAKSDVQLANRSLELFGMFTKEVPRAFIKPEIVGRLASMLDYNLEAIVGPKCSQLKVKEPEKYDFNPKELLLSISKVFVNLSGEKEFIEAVAHDSRSFKRSLFTRAEDILTRFALESEQFIKTLVKFADAAEAARISEEEEEMELGEIPDEYLDPLMFTLMEDPVILPSSKVNIDRATIRAHLLSDSTDPFNRMPLKFEDVIPNDELKKEIQDFKARMKAKGKDVEMTDA